MAVRIGPSVEVERTSLLIERASILQRERRLLIGPRLSLSFYDGAHDVFMTHPGHTIIKEDDVQDV